MGVDVETPIRQGLDDPFGQEFVLENAPREDHPVQSVKGADFTAQIRRRQGNGSVEGAGHFGPRPAGGNILHQSTYPFVQPMAYAAIIIPSMMQ